LDRLAQGEPAAFTAFARPNQQFVFPEINVFEKKVTKFVSTKSNID
jgi:hypothetical protein